MPLNIISQSHGFNWPDGSRKKIDITSFWEQIFFQKMDGTKRSLSHIRVTVAKNFSISLASSPEIYGRKRLLRCFIRSSREFKDDYVVWRCLDAVLTEGVWIQAGLLERLNAPSYEFIHVSLSKLLLQRE